LRADGALVWVAGKVPALGLVCQVEGVYENGELMKKLETKLAGLPDAPGVYQFFDADGRILYVGKARSLKKRVRSYFRGRPDRAKTALLLTRVVDFEVILAGSEIEALLLENNLIKEHRPPFNIDLKDDKNYPYLRLDLRDEFPRFEIVRRRRSDGARYFGPFPAVTALRSTLKVLNRHFRLRRCHGRRFQNRVRPCLNFEMGFCSGPCCGRIPQAAYRRALSEAALILSGRGRTVLRALKRRMERAAGKLEFEEAARLRDAIADLEKVMAAQQIDVGRDEDLEILGLAGGTEKGAKGGADRGLVALYRLTVRRGFLIAGRPYLLTNYGGNLEELPAAFLQRHYAGGEKGGEIPPPVIIGPGFGEARAGLEAWLGRLRGGRVQLVVPQRGRRLRLLELAAANAADFLKREENRLPGSDAAAGLAELARVMKLEKPPEIIEGLDISHLGSGGVVAALVSFRGGEKRPDDYRRYRLDQPPPDDFARMAEVVRRRFGPLAKGDEESRPAPDLLLLDGGRAQLMAVERVLEEIGIEVPLVAIAKGRDAAGRKDRRVADLFYQPGRRDPLSLTERSPARRLLMEIRDEAHRFALDYQRRRRQADQGTRLTSISGIGPRRARKLLLTFGSLEGVAAAGVEELVSAGLPRSLAERVRKQLALGLY